MSKKTVEFMQKNKRLFSMHLFSFGVLVLGFLLCRYVFFNLHGMEEWPVDLLIAGLVVQLISLLAGKQYAPWFSAVGYSLGFWLGAIFHTEKPAKHGGINDNLWQIWTIVFLICILAGVVFEIVRKWRKLIKNRHPKL